MRTHTPALNHNHSCGERESERSTVAKSQNALHFSLCDINQFFPHSAQSATRLVSQQNALRLSQKTPLLQSVSSVLQSLQHGGNINELLRKKKWQYFLCWLSPILSCERLTVHHSATEDTEVIYFKHFTPFSMSFSRTMFYMKRNAPVIRSLVPLEWTKRPIFQLQLMTLHLHSFDNAVS